MKINNAAKCIGICTVLGLMGPGCQEIVAKNKSVSNQTVLGSSSTAPLAMSLVVTQQGSSSPIFSDTGNLTLVAGKSYIFKVSGPACVTLSMKQVDIIGAAPSTMSGCGSIPMTFAKSGNYSMSFQASGTAATKVYQASVNCASPTFTAGSLNANAVSVSKGSGPNLYNISAAGIAAGANGMAPYTCSFGVAGSQISLYTDCSAGLTDAYVPYVGSRNLEVVVTDSCNTSYSVAAPRNIGYSVPGVPGNTFIYGSIANASGSLKNDERMAGIYLAQNSNGHNVVHPQYGGNAAAGTGSFTIQSTLNYGNPGTKDFGIVIKVGNIVGAFDPYNGGGTLDASSLNNAAITEINYVTDEQGDVAPQVSATGSNCQWTNRGIRTTFIQGKPCTSGPGDTNKWSVEVWGNYSCILQSPSGQVTLTGIFDGTDDMVDSCSGGGGGGGGVQPIGI